jgi:hypothetical protein
MTSTPSSKSSQPKPLPALLLLPLIGCASSPTTTLDLQGNPTGLAHYEFKQTVHRATPLGPEFIAYGLIYFDNSELSRYHDRTWPRSGYVTFRLRATPLSGTRYAIALLGPARSAGPGDDEILSAIAAPDQYTLTESAAVAQLVIHDLPMQSRNHPDLHFTLNGTLHSTPATERHFAGHLDDFTWDYNSRMNAGPTPPPFPPQ